MLLLLLSCTDYAVHGLKHNGGADDTGTSFDSNSSNSTTTTLHDTAPNDCQDRNFPAGKMDQEDECFAEGTPVGSFTPVVEWSKGTFKNTPASNQVMMMPAVGPLTDTTGDGVADEKDIPDIVLITYDPPVLRVLSGDGGKERWSAAANDIQGQGGVALADIDNDGWTDIVVALLNGVAAYDHTGARMWTGPNLTGKIFGTSDNPAISDMDGDGKPEIIIGKAILSNKGALLTTGPSGMGGVNSNNVGTTSFAVDLDGDGVQEVITGNSAFHKDGSVLWNNGDLDGYVAVGNFDGDAKGEVVVSNAGNVRLLDHNGKQICTAPIPGASAAYYGGPATVADFDGDGEPEFALAAGSRYSVFKKNCSVLWQAQTQDASSGNTGSSVFDFEGDGAAEAVYGDETRLWVFSGVDGSVKLESTDHTNATWLEYPVVADVDGDGHAEIVVPNTYNFGGGAQYTGITVIGDAADSWRSGRRIWNQHAYHITNINDDGSIPKAEAQNWLTYNNFRSGDIGAGSEGYSAPDLVPVVDAVCSDECRDGRLYLWVSLGNAGFDDVTASFDLEVIGVQSDGTEVSLDSAVVSDPVPAASTTEAIKIVLKNVPSGLKSIRVSVDGGDNASKDSVDECVEDNNTVVWKDNLCH